MSLTFERVAGPFGFTEGPTWDGEALYFSDSEESVIRRYWPDCDEWDVFVEDAGSPIGLKFGPDGALYACEGSNRRVVCYGDSIATVAEAYRGDPFNRPNDLTFDSRGHLWFTDPDYTGQGGEIGHDSIYRVEPTGGDEWTIRRIVNNTTRPNGILIAKNDDRLYVAESKYGDGNDRELRSYPVTPDEPLNEYDVLHNFYPHRGIDGMCLTRDGNIIATAGWSDSGPGPMLYVFAPTGRVIETHPYPGDTPTNCTLVGKTLYVTDANGNLYRAETTHEAPD